MARAPENPPYLKSTILGRSFQDTPNVVEKDECRVITVYIDIGFRTFRRVRETNGF